MYPILILRAEVVCLIVLIFLIITAKNYKMGKDSSAFYRLAVFAIAHVVLDVVTVLTVNRLDSVPQNVNIYLHVAFYLTAILFSNEVCNYAIKVCYPRAAKALYITGFAITAAYLAVLIFAPVENLIEFAKVDGTNSSSGFAPYVGFAVAFLFFVFALAILLINYKKLSKPVKNALIPMIIVLIIIEAAQIVVKELLFTGAAVTIVTLGFFFSLENPALVFEQKMSTDALTGVKSRHRYEMDLEELEKKYTHNPNGEYTFAFCDINNLRNVNNRFGHQEGDHYIMLAATALTASLKKANSIYRIGGDEFLVFYEGVPEETIRTELTNAKKKLALSSKELDYTAGFSVGYAISGPEYKNLKDVINTADFFMYEDKARKNSARAHLTQSAGTGMNISGLTSRIFDAMCSSNGRSYPFITNLETNVTRVSPAWKDYFGLDSEFSSDFVTKWLEYIHPDDRKTFTEDLAAAINGKQRYHSVEVRAKNPAGEYVLCSIHGSVYHGSEEEPDIFAGFLINHGVADKFDASTGLPNFIAMEEDVKKIIDSNKRACAVKIRIDNLGRVDLLYGYDGSSRVLKRIAEITREEVGSSGTVYCNEGCNFSILLKDESKEKAKVIFKNISNALSSGVQIGDSFVPMTISGGGVVIRRDVTPDVKTARSSVLSALEESEYAKHGRLLFYDEIQSFNESANYKLLSEIHADAIAGGNGFKLRFQPIVDSQSGKLFGAEALLRFDHPKYGEISPARFISFIENDPCYIELGMKVLEMALNFAKEIRKSFPDFVINVNITSLQLQRDNFIEKVEEKLSLTNYPSSGLVLELTERCKEMDGKFLSERIAEIRKRGLRVAFDDMGTGYSTLDLLMNVPVDEIKLDREFVLGIKEKPLYQVFVQALFQASKSTDCIICFEGVETKEMLDYLKNMGPSVTQGYYYSKPLLAQDFLTYSQKFL